MSREKSIEKWAIIYLVYRVSKVDKFLEPDSGDRLNIAFVYKVNLYQNEMQNKFVSLHR